MGELFNEDEFAARYKKRLAIIVPYRDRADHLTKFMLRTMTYFQRDKLDKHIQVTFHIVEQLGTADFNRGKICNCGYRLVQDNCDYVCFHDVDYLPVWADYSWPVRPTRLVRFGLKPGEYREYFFGAVVLFSNADFESVNGFPNAYWGWGKEDRELGLRCRHVFGGFDSREGTFTRLPHEHRGFVRSGILTEEALRTQALFRTREPEIERWMAEDGLSTLNFEAAKNEPLHINGTIVPGARYHQVEIGAQEN